MSLFSKPTYITALRKHYKKYFGTSGTEKKWTKGPQDKLHRDFYVLEIEPNQVHNMWTYLTVGMSLERTDDNLIELFVYSPTQADSLVELLTINASFHRNSEPLNIHHTISVINIPNIARVFVTPSITRVTKNLAGAQDYNFQVSMIKRALSTPIVCLIIYLQM
jgi:hypothetical protein